MAIDNLKLTMSLYLYAFGSMTMKLVLAPCSSPLSTETIINSLYGGNSIENFFDFSRIYVWDDTSV